MAFINIFNSLSAPYLLYSGSLLMMFRNCGIGDSDIDFSLELDWWKENKEVLDNALVGAGFSHTLTFGSIDDTWGYEEAWQMHGWKVDIFTNIMVGNIHKVAVWIQGKKYPCTITRWKILSLPCMARTGNTLTVGGGGMWILSYLVFFTYTDTE